MNRFQITNEPAGILFITGLKHASLSMAYFYIFRIIV